VQLSSHGQYSRGSRELERGDTLLINPLLLCRYGDISMDQVADLSLPR